MGVPQASHDCPAPGAAQNLTALLDRRAMGGDPAEEEVSIVMFGRF
jgi:hypothetical protein